MSDNADIHRPGRLQSLLAKLIRPADDWAHAGGERKRSALLVLMTVLLGILALAGLVGVRLAAQADDGNVLLTVLLVLLAIAGVIIVLLMYQVRYHLLGPMAEMYAWALRMCDGDLSARIPTRQTGQFAKLTYHINRLSEALEKLANEMDDAVWTQTERLQQKNQSLETLYEVAATINTCDDLEELLERATRRLMGTVKASAAAIRLRDEDGAMQVIKRIEFDDRESSRLDEQEIDSQAVSEIEAELDCEALLEDVEIRRVPASVEQPAAIVIPLRYQLKTLGTLCLYTRSPAEADGSEVPKLFANVGKHLGMAIAKARLDEESRNLSLIRERNSLAHELHDSLAQTLAGLRFQVQMVTETLEKVDAPAARHEMVRIQNSLDEANSELRELIANFRTPVDAKGALPALRELTERFRKESGIATYLQIECADLQLSPVSELQVLRIVREALNNARKHSGAQTVRVLVRCDGEGSHRILVEDDGAGLGEPTLDTHPGEHLGLSIMQERARRIGGDLKIESEPGEGTRISLSFRTDVVTSLREEQRRAS